MPTPFTHAAVPIALGFGLGKHTIPGRLIAAGIFASVIPDIDIVSYSLSIPYSSPLSHRGATHSLAFAVLLGVIAGIIAPQLRAKRLTSFFYVTISTASHGLLDMLSNGGQGIAYLWPYISERYFFPWRVIEAAPLSLRRIIGLKGWFVLGTELLWVWLPAAVLFVITAILTAKKPSKTN